MTSCERALLVLIAMIIRDHVRLNDQEQAMLNYLISDVQSLDTSLNRRERA
jgi:hypothetical protein